MFKTHDFAAEVLDRALVVFDLVVENSDLVFVPLDCVFAVLNLFFETRDALDPDVQLPATPLQLYYENSLGISIIA
jgi:hypothetical protein